MLTGMTPRAWFDWTNFGTGLSGLALTLCAIRQATGAKQAATDTRDAIRQRGASDAFAELANTAGQLVNAIRSERSGEAAVRASDLVAQIARDRAKYERFLAADSIKLNVLASKLEQLAVQLSAPDPLTEDEKIQKATSDAHETSRVLNEICGRLMDRRDEEER
jgi:hypothetical protein